MTRLRPILALAVATLAVGSWSVTPAGAGSPTELRSDIDCDTATGQWVVTYTLSSGNNAPLPIVSSWTLSSGGQGELDFDPSTVLQGSPTTAELRLPGTSTGTLTASAGPENFGQDETVDELDGSCKAAVVTTTSTTAAPTTTTEAAAAPAAPRYTG